MLSSDEFDALRRDHPVVLVRRDEDAVTDLMDRFGVWRSNAWCVVLDERGEVLDSFACDAAAAGCTAGETERFPPKLADALRKSLALEESLEDMRRRATEDPTDVEAYERFVGTLVRFQARTRLLEFAERALADERTPDPLRRRSDMHRATSRMRIHMTTEKRVEDPAPLVADAIRALALEPGYVHAELLRITIWSELGLEFDLPRWRALVAARFAEVRGGLDPGAVRDAFDAHGATLLGSFDRQIAAAEAIMVRYRSGDVAGMNPVELMAAPIQVGDARIVLDLIADGYLVDSRVERWKREAEAKLGR